MNSLKWTNYRHRFEPRSGLRDIYVFGTNDDDWRTLLQCLKELGGEITYRCRGQEAATPQTFREANSTTDPLLTILIGNCTLNCHFYLASEIEFDVDPKEIVSEVEFDSVVRFMKTIATLLRREVVLTEEGRPTDVILQVEH